MHKLLLLCACAASATLGICAVPAAAPAGRKTELTARLVTPLEVQLEWTHPDPRAAGYTVEYDTDPQGEFVILAFCPAGTTTYLHPRLVPQTKFYYRVRAYYGDATAPVKVTVAEGVSDADYAAAYARPEDYSWAAPTKNPAAAAIAQAALKNAADFGPSAPSHLHAEVIKTTSSGFLLTWIDHALDEEGFLIERKQVGEHGFSVCAMVEPDINAFGWAFEPPQRMGEFRVRAFYLGKPSALATQTTGQGPPELDDPADAPVKTP